MTTFVVLALILGTAAAFAARARMPWLAANLILVAVAVRVVGATVRYEVLFRAYNGIGDAFLYFDIGSQLARGVTEGGLSPFSAAFWPSLGARFGTLFVTRISGLVLIFIGPNLRAEFLVFSMLSFVGIAAIVIAFWRSHRSVPAVRRFALWVFLWPSLWFWPSSVGKESLILLAIGITTLGYVGKRQHINWPVYLAGLLLAAAIRPHVATILALATMAAEWLGTNRRLTWARIFQAGAIVVALGLMFQTTLSRFDVETDLEGILEFVETSRGATLQGGSRVSSTATIGVAQLPMAFINTWARPFPWEIHNATAAASSLEIVLLWIVVIRYRRGLHLALRNWRSNRLLVFAVPFLVAYTLMIGLTFVNMGILARQRTPMFPFVFAALAQVALFPARSRQPVRNRRAMPPLPAPTARIG